MTEKIFLNDYEIEANIVDFKEIVNKPTGNKIKQIDIKCNITGKTQFKKISNILKDKFTIKIPSKKIEFEAKATSHSSSYTGDLDNITPVSYKINIDEIDKDLPEKWDYRIGMGIEIVSNYARIIALLDCLIEKNIINEKDINEKYLKIIDEKSRKIINKMCYGTKDTEE